MYKKINTFIIFELFILFQVNQLCAQTILEGICEGSIFVKTDEYEGIIFGVNCPANKNNDTTYRWMPTEKDISQAEYLIKRYIIKSVKKRGLPNQFGSPIVHLNFDKYYRQYFGYKDKRGQRILFVMCFWKEKECEFPYWKQNIVGICGGGSYYWHITVNLKRKKCYDYSVHQ